MIFPQKHRFSRKCMKTTVPTATHQLTGGLSDMYCAYTVNILPALMPNIGTVGFLHFPRFWLGLWGYPAVADISTTDHGTLN